MDFLLTKLHHFWLAAEPLVRYVATYDPMRGSGFPTLERLQEMLQGSVGSASLNLLIAVLIALAGYWLSRRDGGPAALVNLSTIY